MAHERRRLSGRNGAQDKSTEVRIEPIAQTHSMPRSCNGKSSTLSMKSSLARNLNDRKLRQSLGRGDKIISSPTLRIKTSFKF